MASECAEEGERVSVCERVASVYLGDGCVSECASMRVSQCVRAGGERLKSVCASERLRVGRLLERVSSATVTATATATEERVLSTTASATATACVRVIVLG